MPRWGSVPGHLSRFSQGQRGGRIAAVALFSEDRQVRVVDDQGRPVTHPEEYYSTSVQVTLSPSL
jgi:hypothetical protein